MKFTNSLWITEGEAFVFTGQLFGKLVKILQIPSDIDLGIEEYRNNGLGGTCVVDYLSGKEQVIIVDCEVLPGLKAFLPLEQEDKPINIWLDLVNQLIVFHAVNFLNLDWRSANLLH